MAISIIGTGPIDSQDYRVLLDSRFDRFLKDIKDTNYNFFYELFAFIQNALSQNFGKIRQNRNIDQAELDILFDNFGSLYGFPQQDGIIEGEDYRAFLKAIGPLFFLGPSLSAVQSVSDLFAAGIGTAKIEEIIFPSLPSLIGGFTLNSSGELNGETGLLLNPPLSCLFTIPISDNANANILPPGLFLSGEGVLSGTPTLAGLFPFIVRATDFNDNMNFDIKFYALQINNADGSPFTGGLSPKPSISSFPGLGAILKIVTDSLPRGQVGVEYEKQIEVTKGMEFESPHKFIVTFELASNILPNNDRIKLIGFGIDKFKPAGSFYDLIFNFSGTELAKFTDIQARALN